MLGSMVGRRGKQAKQQRGRGRGAIVDTPPPKTMLAGVPLPVVVDDVLQKYPFLASQNAAYGYFGFVFTIVSVSFLSRKKRAPKKVKDVVVPPEGSSPENEVGALSDGAKPSVAHQKNRAATTIQSLRRSLQEQENYKAARQAAVRLQSSFRKERDQSSYVNTCQSIRRIQSLTRSLAARSAYAQTRRSVVQIQALSRRRLSCSLSQKRLHAICRVQVSVKRLLVRSKHRLESRRQFDAATLIQSVARKIQAQYRYQTQRTAAIEIQGIIRRYLARQVFLSFRHDARATEVLREQSATCIQGVARTTMARRKFAKSLKAVLLVQSLVRKLNARSLLERSKKAAVIIQTNTRKATAVAQLQTERQAAIRIQSLARTASAYKLVVGQKERTRAQDEQRQRAAAAKLQAIARGRIVKALLEKQIRAAIVLQAFSRANRDRIAYKASLLNVRSAWLAATRIQALAKGHLSRRMLRRRIQATTSLQALSRARRAQTTYKASLRGVVAIQKMIRSFRIKKQQENQLVRAAVDVQRWVRATRERSSFKTTIASVVAIQTLLRAARARKALRSLKQQEERRLHAAILLQVFYRALRDRNAYKASLGKVARIQAVTRSFLVRRCKQEKEGEQGSSEGEEGVEGIGAESEDSSCPANQVALEGGLSHTEVKPLEPREKSDNDSHSEVTVASAPSLDGDLNEETTTPVANAEPVACA